MTPAFEKLQKHLKQLPGLGFRSSERIALHLLVEKPERLPALVLALHGGCGTLPRQDLSPEDWAEAERHIADALGAGWAILARGGAAVDAVASYTSGRVSLKNACWVPG